MSFSSNSLPPLFRQAHQTHPTNPKTMALINAGLWGKVDCITPETRESRGKKSANNFKGTNSGSSTLISGVDEGKVEKDGDGLQTSSHLSASYGLDSKKTGPNQIASHVKSISHSSSSSSRSPPLRGILATSKPRSKERGSSQESEDSFNNPTSNPDSNNSSRSPLNSPISSASSLVESVDQASSKKGRKRVRFDENLDEEQSEGAVDELEKRSEIETKTKHKKLRSGRISVSRKFENEVMY